MYHYLLNRQRDLVTQFEQLLRLSCEDMALDPRFYNHLGHGTGPSSQSSITSAASAVTGITSPSFRSTNASSAALRSTASSPSLRAKEHVVMSPSRVDGVASPSPGGNVRVVVRVRNFLPRGMYLLLRWVD